MPDTLYLTPDLAEVRRHLVRAVMIVTDQMPATEASADMRIWARDEAQHPRVLTRAVQDALDWVETHRVDMAMFEALTMLWWACVHTTHDRLNTAILRADWAVQALSPGLTYRPTSEAYRDLLDAAMGRAGWLPPTMHDRQTMVVRYLSDTSPRVRGWVGVYADYTTGDDQGNATVFWSGGCVTADGARHTLGPMVGTVMRPIEAVEAHSRTATA